MEEKFFKTCHICQKKSDISNTQEDTYALEDYLVFGSVHKAAEINEQIFLDPWNVEYVKSMTYGGYEVAWSFYDSIYHSFSFPSTQLEPLLEKISPYDNIILHNLPKTYASVIRRHCFDKRVTAFSPPYPPKKLRVKNLLMSIAAGMESLAAIIFFLFSRRKTAIRTSDSIMQGQDADFRLVELYKQLRAQNIKFLEFVRLRDSRSILRNFFIRKRPVIYYEPFLHTISLFIRTKPIPPRSIYHSALLSYDRNIRTLIKTVPLFRFLYKLLGVKSLWVGSFLDRVAVLAVAAKCSKVKTVGVKSGAGTKAYDVYDFVQPYWSEKKLGPDVFGVWSPWWAECIKKYNKILPEQSVHYSGPLRPVPVGTGLCPFRYDQNKKIKILVLSEPLTNPRETAPYLAAIAQDPRFSLAIKLRPSIQDTFYNELIKIIPEAESWPKYTGNIFEDGKNADVFIGAHTTALLEASLIGKISVFINTQKWEDYFDVSNLIPEFPMLVNDPGNLAEHIIERMKKETKLKTIEKIKYRYFGENKNGAEWAARELGAV